MNHKWYRNTFKDYPKHRRAIIPFVLWRHKRLSHLVAARQWRILLVAFSWLLFCFCDIVSLWGEWWETRWCWCQALCSVCCASVLSLCLPLCILLFWSGRVMPEQVMLGFLVVYILYLISAALLSSAAMCFILYKNDEKAPHSGFWMLWFLPFASLLFCVSPCVLDCSNPSPFLPWWCCH